MNIFATSFSPRQAAYDLPDKLVVKMILETAQLLCTAHRVLDGTDTLEGQELYKETHKNHPCAVWVRESRDNYFWAYDHFVALCNAYTYRYGKVHATDAKFREVLWTAPKQASYSGLTPPPACMPDEFKVEDQGSWPTASYRKYLALGKSYMADLGKAYRIPTEIPYWAKSLQHEA